MNNMNNVLETIDSNLKEIHVVNTQQDSTKLLALVEKSTKLNGDQITKHATDNEINYNITLLCLKRIKIKIKSIIQETLSSRFENDGEKYTLWERLRTNPSKTKKSKLPYIYKDGSVDMKKLIEKEDELKFYDIFFTKKLCGELLDLYEQCDKITQLIVSKGYKKRIKINEKERKMNKELFIAQVLKAINIGENADKMSKKFGAQGVSVSENSIKKLALKLMNEKADSKSTFYLSDVDDTKKEIEENCDWDKIYESVKRNDNYKYFIEEKLFENLSKNNIETAKKETKQHICELIGKRVESRNKVNKEVIDSIINEVFGFILDKFDIEG